MRIMLRTHIDATQGSAALKSGAFQKAIGVFIEKFKPEATYFGLESGRRTGFFVFDMKPRATARPYIGSCVTQITGKIRISW